MVENPSQLDECLQRAVEGDQSALQQLLVVHCPALSRQISKELGESVPTTVAVDDILQETLILAVRDFGSLRSPSPAAFSAWLRAIAEHRIQDTLRAARRQKRRADRPASRATGNRSTNSFIIDLVQLVSDGGDSPSQKAAAAEAVHAVQVGVASLPDDQRQAIELRYLRGLSTQEAATEMERTPGAIRGLVSRAKQSLRTAARELLSLVQPKIERPVAEARFAALPTRKPLPPGFS